MRYLSPAYPNLYVADAEVQFIDGVADVVGKQQIARCDRLRVLGVVRAPDQPAPKRTRARKGAQAAPSADESSAADGSTVDESSPADGGADESSAADGSTVDESSPADGGADESSTGDGAAASEQPKGNASRDEWAAYAEELGIVYPPAATRDELKELVVAHQAADGD